MNCAMLSIATAEDTGERGGKERGDEAGTRRLSTVRPVFSALAYYYDHQEQLDREIAERQRAADEFFAKRGENPAMTKLRAARDQRS